MQQQAKLFEAPEFGGDMLFSLKDIIYTPEAPRMKEPFTVKGKVELFKIPFMAPVWVQARVTYPEKWWEEIIPIIGSPTIAEGKMVIGGTFEITFTKGFDREGDFLLEVLVYAGPTYSIDKIMLPPFPPVATEEMTFTVAGEVPPEEIEGFRNLRIVSYSKNAGPPITPPEVLELEVGDRCRVNVALEHKGSAVTKDLYSAIGTIRLIIGFDEIIHGSKRISVGASADWQPHEGYVDIVITSAIDPGIYSLYAKIDGVIPDAITPYYENVITIAGIPVKPQFRNLEIVSYDERVAIGGTCHVKAHFDYQGPGVTKEFYAAIGTIRPVIGFDEVIHGSNTWSIPSTPSWKAYEATTDIAITTAIDPGVYDLYAKIDGVIPDAITPYYENVITIEEVAPPAPEAEFRNLAIVSYDERLAVGDTCHIKVHFDYQGPRVTKELYAAIGNIRLIIGFDEIIHGSKRISVGASADWQPYEGYVDIVITSAIDPGIYSLYAKIDGVIPDAITPYYENVITITEEAPPPPPEPPEVDILAARDITHDSATLRGQLIETGRCNVVYCYFEWGETTDYGEKTPEVRMDGGDIGQIFYAELLHFLEPNTTYHFRAVGVTRCTDVDLYSYSPDRSFTTEEEVAEGFTMRVINAPAGTIYWHAGDNIGVPYPVMKLKLPLSSTWEWEPYYYVWDHEFIRTRISDEPRDFFIVGIDSANHHTQVDIFPFRIRPGKNYVWDFAAHEMRDDGIAKPGF